MAGESGRTMEGPVKCGNAERAKLHLSDDDVGWAPTAAVFFLCMQKLTITGEEADGGLGKGDTGQDSTIDDSLEAFYNRHAAFVFTLHMPLTGPIGTA